MANFRPPPQRSVFQHSVKVEASQNLWVGNLAEDMTEGALMEGFAKYGEVESVALYPNRSYAFVYFKYTEHAKAAKEALNGRPFGPSILKIEFARPAKPSKHIWIGGVSQNITREQMEAEFLKFGHVEEFKFLRDRSCAIVDYSNLEDAISAVKTLNGKKLGGDTLRVDFLRSQPVKRESVINSHLHTVEVRDGHTNNQHTFMGTTDLLRRNHETMIYPPEPFQGILTNVQTAHGLEGGRLEGVPSNVLRICFPPSFKIDEQRLHNALILFGEIEWIKIFPSKHYALVEFRSVEEARHAKDGLQGRLFNDPRIEMFFMNCEYGSVDNVNDNVALMIPLKRPLPSETPYRTSSNVGPIERLGSVSEADPINVRGRTTYIRSVGPQGYPELQTPELRIPLSRLEPFHSFSDINKPAPFIATDLRPLRPSQGSWDGFDASALQRESKRPRVGEPYPVLGLLDTRKRDEEAGGSLSGYYGPQLKKQIPECTNASNGREILGFVDKQGAHVDGSNQPVVWPGHLAPPLLSAGGMNSGHWGQQYRVMKDDCCWQGTISKGGTPVCRARCISVGKGIDAKFPEVINCSARTDLDTLAKHFSQASDYGLVYFLPEGDQDVHPYQEFLHYLGSKHRAGVSKFSNGTTIFLVPPSDFSEQILKVQDTDRLFGIVLKFLQQPVSAIYQNVSNPTPHDPSQRYQQRQLCDVSEKDHAQVPLKDDPTQFNTHMSISFSPKKTLHTIQTTKKCASQMSSLQSPTVPLTPNLIATLSSIVPNVFQASGPGPVSSVSSSSLRHDSYSSTGVYVSSTVNGQGVEPEPLRQHQHQPPLPSKHPRQEHGTYRDQLQHYNQSTYSTLVTASMPSSNKTLEVSEQLDSSFHQSSVTHQTTANEIVHLPSFLVQSRDALGQVILSHAQDHYHEIASANSHNSNGQMLTTEISANIQSSISSQVKSASSRLPDQYHGGAPQVLPNMQLGSNEMKSEVSSQVQQLQGLGATLLGQRQEDSESEAEKNQRYQQTLQFAASLLLQLQQNQAGNKSVTGSAQHPQ